MFIIPCALFVVFLICGIGFTTLCVDLVPPAVWVIGGLVVLIAVIAGIIARINDNR